jgi:hypothetical protein
LRIAVNVDGKDHVVEFDRMPSESDIDEVAGTIRGSRGSVATMPAPAPVRPAAQPQARPSILMPPGQVAPPVVGRVRTIGQAPTPQQAQAFRSVAESLQPQIQGHALPAQGPSQLQQFQQTLPKTAKDIVKRAEPTTPPKKFNGVTYKHDPFEGLPFTQEDFEASVNEPNRPVPLKGGGTVTFAQAAAAVTKHTGQREFKPTANYPDEDVQAQQSYDAGGKAGVGKTVGFKKSQTDKQVPRGADAKAAYDKANFVDGRRITQSEKNIKALEEVKSSASKSLQSVGVPEGIAGLVTGIAASPLDFGTDLRRAFDPEETPANKAGAAANVLLASATSAVGGKVLEGLTAPVRAGLVDAIKGTKIGKALLESKSPEEAVRLATEHWNVSPQVAQHLVDDVAEHSPEIKWANGFDEHGNPTQEAKPRPKPQSAAEQAAAKKAETPAVESTHAPTNPDHAGERANGAGNPEPVRTGNDPQSTQKPAEVSGADPVGQENTTSLTVAQRQKEAETLGTAEPKPVKQLSNAEAHAKGKADVESGAVDPYELVKKLSNESRAAKPDEYGAILEGKRRLLQDINRTRKAVDDAVGKEGHAEASAAYEAAKARAAEFDGHLDNVKGASGGSLQSLKIGTTVDEGDFAAVVSEARRKKGADLSPNEEGKLKALVEAHNKQIADIEAQHAKELEAAAQQAHSTRPRTKVPKTAEARQAERAAAWEVLKTKTVRAEEDALAASGEVRLNSGVRLLTKEQADAIVTLARSYGEEGAEKLSDVVAKIRQGAKDAGITLSEQEVQQAISGQYEKQEGKVVSKTQGQQQLLAWRRELRDASSAASKAKRSAEVAERKAKAAELTQARQEGRKAAQETRKQTKAEYEKLFGEQSRLEDSIAKMQERLKTGDLAGKPKPERSPELERMYQKRDFLRGKIRQEIENKRPKSTGEKIGRFALDVANVPRTIKTSFDLSAPLRQGMILTLAHPVLGAKAFSGPTEGICQSGLRPRG